MECLYTVLVASMPDRSRISMQRARVSFKIRILAIITKGNGRKVCLMAMGKKVTPMETIMKDKSCMEQSLVKENIHLLMVKYIMDSFTTIKAMERAA